MKKRIATLIMATYYSLQQENTGRMVLVNYSKDQPFESLCPHNVDILGPSTIIYRPNKPLSCGRKSLD